MKIKFLFTFALLLTFACCSELSAARSPIDQSAFVISGSANMTDYGGEAYVGYYGHHPQTRTINFAISGFLRPGLAIGFQLNHFNYSEISDDDSNLFGPRLTYYFGDPAVDHNTYPFLAIGYGFGESGVDRGVEYPFYPWKTSSELHSVQLSAGLTFVVGHSLGITAELVHRRDFLDRGSEGWVNGYSTAGTVGLSLLSW